MSNKKQHPFYRDIYDVYSDTSNFDEFIDDMETGREAAMKDMLEEKPKRRLKKDAKKNS